MRVKICGLTNEADARQAIEAGADALGINLFPGSKRYVALETVLPWVKELPLFVERVAVMVNPTYEEVLQVMGSGAFGLVQLHGDEPPGFCEKLVADEGLRVIKALPLRGRDDFEKIFEYEKMGLSALLVDAYVPGEFGGTGKLIDLEVAAELAHQRLRIPLILSGGLHPENVAGAVEKVRPYAVDVASGVEGATPRNKDFAKLRAFVAGANQGAFGPVI
ncbi:MAG: phosphoribosylanthranilate isomerase [Chthoniobacteraceae bacterium]